MGWRRTTATAASFLTVVLLVAAVALVVSAPTRGGFAFLAVGFVVAPMSAALGLLVVRRHPTNAVGLLLALVALSVAFVVTKEIGWRVLAMHPQTADGLAWLVAVLNESGWWAVAAVALLFAYFPDGNLPGRRWRLVPSALIACTAVTQVTGAMDVFPPPLQEHATPFGPAPPWLQVVSIAAFAAQLILILACTISPAVRFRRASPTHRTQIKWLALCGLGIPLYLLICLAEIALWERPVWGSWAVLALMTIGVPVAAATAVLRHDLYDVDKALAGSVTWTVLTAGLFGVYALASIVAGLVLTRGSAAAAAAVTALCALSLTPARLRLQRLVDRRLYPLRRAAFAALETLHQQTSTGRARPEELQDVLRVALRDPDLRVGFVLPGTEQLVDVDGRAVEPERGTPVVLDGNRIGALVPGTHGIASAELLRQVSVRAATLVEVVRLRLQLANTLREVEASRTRLLQIGYEERRRLERDLHDGAQQRLVSLGMALRLAQRHLGDGSVNVNDLLEQSVAELTTAVAELRQIAHGLRPSSLDDGLQAALAGALRTVPATVDLDVSVDALPDDVATTAYYVVSEAVANAVKHASASSITVRVESNNGNVLVRVTDDGRGGADLPSRAALRDRVAALKGTLHLHSPGGGGTIIEAKLPCAS